MNTYLVTTSVLKRIWLLDEPEQLLLSNAFAIDRAIEYVANNLSKAELQANQYTLSPQPSPMVYAMGRCIEEAT